MTDSKKYTKSEKMAQEYIERDAKKDGHFEAEESKSTAKIEVVGVIYTHISTWVGREVKYRDPIPNLRPRSFGDRQPDTILVDKNVSAILEASHIYKTPELKQRLEALEKIKIHAEEMRREIAALDSGLMASAMNAARNLQPNLEGRVVAAMGADVAAYMGLEAIAVGVSEKIAYLNLEIKHRPKKAGRARNEAAHKVALEAAKLYAKITGEKPTYSENQGGVSGKYTPFLADIFNRFGWNGLSLKSPAQNAISAISMTDYSLDLIPLHPPI